MFFFVLLFLYKNDENCASTDDDGIIKAEINQWTIKEKSLSEKIVFIARISENNCKYGFRQATAEMWIRI